VRHLPILNFDQRPRTARLRRRTRPRLPLRQQPPQQNHRPNRRLGLQTL